MTYNIIEISASIGRNISLLNLITNHYVPRIKVTRSAIARLNMKKFDAVFIYEFL